MPAFVKADPIRDDRTGFGFPSVVLNDAQAQVRRELDRPSVQVVFHLGLTLFYFVNNGFVGIQYQCTNLQ